MAGRLAGSASLHGRRRRRLAADETPTEEANAGPPADGDGRPLPARRPTGRFPLRRVVSRSPWKLAAVGLAALAGSGVAVTAGHVPSVANGTYGPGLAALCDIHSGRLPTALGGLLLLAAGQLSWLVRWARARSLRDFRGGYRIWWWTALAFGLGGAGLLTDAHLALASTAAWLTGRTWNGSDVPYRFAPALLALVALFPALQRDMRGCRASRTLVFTAAALGVAGAGATVAGTQVADAIANSGWTVPPAAVAPALLLAGTAAAFSAMLFHARHVVYESVEPPELPARRKRVAEDKADAESEAEEDTKAKRPASRRASRAKAAEDKAEVKEKAKAESAKPAPAPSKAPRPHIVLKEQVLKEPPKPAPAPAPKPEPVAAKPQPRIEPQPKPEPPKPEPVKPAPDAAKPAPPVVEEDYGEEAAESDGRNYRLDGPQDPLRGLSKRERRKLKKEMKHQHGDDD